MSRHGSIDIHSGYLIEEFMQKSQELKYGLAMNMTMMTTAQSEIATDLNAFADTTWFNSAFMVFDQLHNYVIFKS